MTELLTVEDIDLDTAEVIARAALVHFDFSPHSTVEFVKYRENHTYRVTEPDGSRWAIRLHRPGYRDRAAIDTEVRWIASLARTGLAVPSVRMPTSQMSTALVAVGVHERRVSAQRWLEAAEPVGDTLDWFVDGAVIDPGVFRSLGGVASDLHEAAQALGRPAWFRRRAWDAAGLVGLVPLWGSAIALPSLSSGERLLLESARHRAFDEISALPVAQTFGVIHGDLTPENVLRRGDDLIAIDFDDFGEGYFAFDLATCMFWGSKARNAPELYLALLDGYARGLRKDELAVFDALVLARATTYLGWAADRPGDDTSEFIVDEVAPWAIHIASTYLGDGRQPWHV